MLDDFIEYLTSCYDINNLLLSIQSTLKRDWVSQGIEIYILEPLVELRERFSKTLSEGKTIYEEYLVDETGVLSQFSEIAILNVLVRNDLPLSKLGYIFLVLHQICLGRAFKDMQEVTQYETISTSSYKDFLNKYFELTMSTKAEVRLNEFGSQYVEETSNLPTKVTISTKTLH